MTDILNTLTIVILCTWVCLAVVPGPAPAPPPAPSGTSTTPGLPPPAPNEEDAVGLIDCNKTEFLAVFGQVPPYAFVKMNERGENETVGSVHMVLEDSLKTCCGSSITLTQAKQVKMTREVEESLDVEDMAYPVVKTSLLVNTGVSSGYLFLPVIETAGAVVMVKANMGVNSVVGESLLSCWPLALIVLFSAGLAGVIVWLLDRSMNDVDFPKSYLKGCWEGTWWAFVTMTTVGYGDRAPKSVPARCFGLIWMFVGIILMSIFTATLTTALSADQGADFEIKGTKIGVIMGSLEEILAYKEGADVMAYEKMTDLLPAINSEAVEAILMDTNFALYHSTDMEDYQLSMAVMIANRAAYGIIVQNQTSAFEQCLARQVSQAQFKVYDRLVDHLGKFQGRNKNIAGQTTHDVLSSLRTICICLGCLWVASIICCLMWEFLWFRPRMERKNSRVKDGSDMSEVNQQTKPTDTDSVFHGERPDSVSSTQKLPLDT